MAYRERRPPEHLGAGVACVWSLESAAATSTRVLPDACADVLWHRGTGELWVAGLDTGPQVSVTAPGTLVGLRFRPGDAALGVPADALRDARVALADLWPARRVLELAERLAGSPDTAAAHRLLLDAFPTTADPATAAIRGLAARTGDVRAMAAALGLGERQLLRRTAAAFGYGPKVLHRVLRFQRALAAARAGTPFADVAHTTGYADQPHLAREVRALAGVPLGALTR